MFRLGASVTACCLLSAPVAAQSTVTPDTFVPSHESGRAAVIDTIVTAHSPAPTLSESLPEVGALLDPTGATFSPRPVFAVRPEPSDVAVSARRTASPVPAPSAVCLLAFAAAGAAHRRAR